MAAQWVQLGAGRVLVANRRGAWLQQAHPGPFGLSGPMSDSLPATCETTRRLLDGAIAAAEHATAQVQPPPMSARRWAWHLVGQWHCAHHSVALLPDLAERFDGLGRADLADFCRQKLDEEGGHDQFPLSDLRSLGYDADALVSELAPEPVISALLTYAGECVRGEDPVEFLGYMYALERRVLVLTDAWFAALDAVLPAGVAAVTGLRVHAGDLDAGHVDSAVSMCAGLGAADRTSIAVGCYRTTEICCAPLPGQHPSEAELDRLLSRFARGSAKDSEQQGER